MATGEDTGYGRGVDEHLKTLGGLPPLMTSLGKVIQEDTTPSSSSGLALKSQLDPKTCQLTNVVVHTNVTQDHTPSKDKGLEEGMLVSNYGHGNMTHNKESSTNWPFIAFRDGHGIAPSSSGKQIVTSGESSSSKESLMSAIQGTVIHVAGPDPSPEDVAIIALESAAPAQSDVAVLVAIPGVVPAEPNVGSIIAQDSVAPAQMDSAIVVDPSSAPIIQLNVDVNVAAPVLALAQPNVAVIVASAVSAPAQPHVVPNVAPTITNVAPPIVAPVQLYVAAVAALHVAPLAVAPVGQYPAANVAHHVVAPAQQNVAPVVPPPAPAQPNAPLIGAPRGAPPAPPHTFNVNGGLRRSQVRPLRTCESGWEGKIWSKLRRN